MNTALTVLHQLFGYPEFRGFQAAVIEHVSHGGDALVLMPTGGGKSLCFQIPILLRRGMGVVVSPLIALMQDQVAALRHRGVAAAFLNASLTIGERQRVVRELQAGRLKLVYVAPERLVSPDFLALLECQHQQGNLALFAIDEAHCIVEWGHDFRPEYRQLGILGQRFPGVPRMALTASADPDARIDILSSLGMLNARQFVGSFDRPNLRYAVNNKKRPLGQLMHFLHRHGPSTSGIIYCPSRRLVDVLAQRLTDEGWPCLPYHAGMDAATRLRHQQYFLESVRPIMVATLAFGMGVDKPDIRYVVHWAAPRTMEGYYQETGRAGRDGKIAEALLLYDFRDLCFPVDRQTQEKDLRERWRALHDYAETERCRRQVLLAYFGETAPDFCGACDCCDKHYRSWTGEARRQSPCRSWIMSPSRRR